MQHESHFATAGANAAGEGRGRRGRSGQHGGYTQAWGPERALRGAASPGRDGDTADDQEDAADRTKASEDDQGRAVDHGSAAAGASVIETWAVEYSESDLRIAAEQLFEVRQAEERQ